MSVKEDLAEALKKAMKARDQIALDAIRAVQSPIKLAEKESKKDLPEEEIFSMIQKAIKQRNDSISSFKQGAREDLAAAEQAQIDVLSQFLPAQLSEAELNKLVDEAIAATGAASIKEMGKVMGWLMPKTKGRADGGAINGLVKSKLGV